MQNLSKRKPLKTYFPNYAAGAIFSQMPQAPWASEEVGLQMDIAYFGEWS